MGTWQQHRHVGFGTQAAQHIKTVHSRQHHIENDRVEVGACLRGQARFAVTAHLDLIATRAQILTQHFHKAGIVVDEKYARWHDKRGRTD